MTDDEIAVELARLLSEGVNTSEAARLIGIGKARAYQIVARFGIATKSPIDNLDMVEVKRMFDALVPYSVMHKLLNVTEYGLRRRIRNEGWTRPSLRPNASPIRLDSSPSLSEFDARGHAKCEDCNSPTHGNRCSPCAVRYAQRIFPPKAS